MTDEELNNLGVRLAVSSSPGVAMEAAPRLLAEVRRLRERLAAFESCDRARRAAEEEAAALKAEVARATDNARMFARAADTEKGNAAGFRADVARLRLDATNARAVAVDAIGWLVAARDTMGLGHQPFITELRERLATPDPAAFVAAVEAYGQWCGTIGASLATGGTQRFLADCERERDTCRAALLALGGVR